MPVDPGFTTEEENAEPVLYRLQTETLGRVASLPDPWLAIRFYEVKLLDLLGFRLQLFQCACCGEEIQAEDQFFSASAGGVLCRRCGARLPGAWEVSMEALKYLRHFPAQQLQRSEAGEPQS